MKSIFSLLLFTFICTCVRAQINVTYATANPRQSEDGLAYEIDILASTSTPFKFGSGQLYFNYDVQAFGDNVRANNRVEVLRPAGSILATANPFPAYQAPIVNDNTTSRVSVAYLQGTSAGCLAGPNVTETPALLFVLRLVFAPGQNGNIPNVCFESAELFANQTFTACGPDGGCNFADCQNDPGTQVTADFFNCSASLPVELLAFSAIAHKGDALLHWSTTTEAGSSHFSVEKSTDGSQWHSIGSVRAAGNSFQQEDYVFNEPNFATSGPTAYYRLRMEDLDGSFTYSDIRFLEAATGATFGPKVFPNPATRGVSIRYAQAPESEERLSLHTVSGEVVRRGRMLPGDGLIRTLSVANLASGVYLLRSSAGWTERVVVR